jgi:hypothetical protein
MLVRRNARDGTRPPVRAPIGVLDPALAHAFIAEIIAVLENDEPGHQRRRQRQPASKTEVRHGTIPRHRLREQCEDPPVSDPPSGGATARHASGGRACGQAFRAARSNRSTRNLNWEVCPNSSS